MTTIRWCHVVSAHMAVQGQDETRQLTLGMGLAGCWLCPWQGGDLVCLSLLPRPRWLLHPWCSHPCPYGGFPAVPGGCIPARGDQAHSHCTASLVFHPTAVGALRDATHRVAAGWYQWASAGAGSHRTVPGAAHLPSPQSGRGAVQLRGRASELEAELAEQRHLKQQAQDESEFLRTELEELKKQREDTEKAQRSLTEIESERGEPVPGSGREVSPGAGVSRVLTSASLNVWQGGRKPMSNGTAS